MYRPGTPRSAKPRTPRQCTTGSCFIFSPTPPARDTSRGHRTLTECQCYTAGLGRWARVAGARGARRRRGQRRRDGGGVASVAEEALRRRFCRWAGEAAVGWLAARRRWAGWRRSTCRTDGELLGISCPLVSSRVLSCSLALLVRTAMCILRKPCTTRTSGSRPCAETPRVSRSTQWTYGIGSLIHSAASGTPAEAARRRRRCPSAAVWAVREGAGGRREEGVCGSRGVVGELEPDRSRSSLLCGGRGDS